MNPGRDVTEDRIFGLHSNIPPCCVEWFCTHTLREIVAYNKHNRKGKFKHVEYVTCPKCSESIRAGTAAPAPLHKCTSDCAPVLIRAGAPEAGLYVMVRDRKHSKVYTT